jgi:hypothetical protein
LSAPTVIVSGTIAATPGQGGATRAVLQYLPGLRHDRDCLNCLLRSHELTAVCLLSLHNTITRSVGCAGPFRPQEPAASVRVSLKGLVAYAHQTLHSSAITSCAQEYCRRSPRPPQYGQHEVPYEHES